ncbi:MAG: GGDEF domain-containing protein [Gammaproteobacteria bacterium]|nr:GGDEF domain-containing protein [Gammaproteobacteria bacterium]NNM19806.1 GGDEF domain-containing protein [Gammaproteobacteria bacterium]
MSNAVSQQLTGPIPFAPVRLWRAGGRQRAAVQAWLLVCAVTIPGGLLTRIFEWTGLAVELGGTTVHLTVYLPLLVCVPLVLWCGFLWAAIPAYFSTLLVAIAGGMSLPWLLVFPLANPLGLAMFALLYRVSNANSRMRDGASVAGFAGVALVASLAGSAGAFVWVYSNRIGADVAYPVWQGWWLGGWLQAVLISLPTLYLLSPAVERWLAPLKPAREISRRDLSHRLLPAIASAVVVLMTYVFAARLFSLRKFNAAAQRISDDEIVNELLNSIDALTYPLFILAAALVAVGFLGYRAAMFWNRSLMDANELLAARNSELARMAETDVLTRVYSRRKAMEVLHLEFERARRTETDFSVMMIDADYFKRINDEHGHLVGDEVISALAQRLAEALREYDVLGRYGGEEFIAILPQASHDDAQHIAERVRAAVAEDPVATAAEPLPVTVSIGFATINDADANENFVLDRADLALLAAKRAGRNRVASGRTVPARPRVTA